MDSMIIVGASGGIGSYLAGWFGKDHHLFLVCHKNQPPAVNATVIQADIEHGEFNVDYLSSRFGPRIILVNAAGVSVDGMGHKMSRDDFNHVLAVNLAGVFNTCRAVLPLMRLRGWGRVINLSSVVGSMGVPGTSAYAASKAGLAGLTRALAVENARKGITVNALNLGYMGIGMIDTLSEENRQAAIERVPMGKLGDPTNVAHAISFLIAADYVTGTTIDIDGGLLST